MNIYCTPPSDYIYDYIYIHTPIYTYTKSLQNTYLIQCDIENKKAR